MLDFPVRLLKEFKKAIFIFSATSSIPFDKFRNGYFRQQTNVAPVFYRYREAKIFTAVEQTNQEFHRIKQFVSGIGGSDDSPTPVHLGGRRYFEG